MKLLCFMVNDKAHLGLKLSDGILDLTANGYTRDLASTIVSFADAKKEIEGISDQKGLALLEESSLHFLAPALPTSKVLCVGLNYKAHADEVNTGDAATEYPKDPILFAKFHNALSAHNGKVPFSSNEFRYDYEAELVIVMGKGGMDIPKEKAAEYIFGYTCGNDVSARGAQGKTSQWLIGKTFPGFAPLGPWIVTPGEFDPCRLAITCRRGEEIVQNSSTEHMIFDIYDIISFASQYICLEPGDLIYTGTPSGVIVGMEREKRVWLKAGESVTVSIEHIGDLTTHFV